MKIWLAYLQRSYVTDTEPELFGVYVSLNDAIAGCQAWSKSSLNFELRDGFWLAAHGADATFCISEADMGEVLL